MPGCTRWSNALVNLLLCNTCFLHVQLVDCFMMYRISQTWTTESSFDVLIVIFLLFGVINPIQRSFNGIWLVSHEQTEHFSNLSLSLEAHARRRRGALELQRSWEGDKNPPHTFQTSNSDSQCNFLQENTRKQAILAHFHHQALGRRPQNARRVVHDELKAQNPLTYGSHETGSSCRYDDEFL